MYILKAWIYRESSRLIENKAISMCLRAADGNEGSPVKTASCDENDTQQVRINFPENYFLASQATQLPWSLRSSQCWPLRVKFWQVT